MSNTSPPSCHRCPEPPTHRSDRGDPMCKAHADDAILRACVAGESLRIDLIRPVAPAPIVLPPRPDLPPPGSVVRHYRGGLYTVLAHAGDSDDRDGPVRVVYQSHATGQVWQRTAHAWLSTVIRQGEPDRVVPRFDVVSEVRRG